MTEPHRHTAGNRILLPQPHVVAVGRSSVVAIDPGCHMEVEVATAKWITEHDGETYYFCSPGCKTAFEKDPSAFLATKAT